jgi:hypothetical protein
MHSILNGLARWVVVVAMGLVTFWPNWGLLWLAITFGPAYPAPVTVVGMVWVVALSLALPFTLRWFRLVSTTALVVSFGGAIYLISTVNHDILTSWPWFMWLVLIVFTAFGWLMISTPLWRWARGVVATTQTPEHHAST